MRGQTTWRPVGLGIGLLILTAVTHAAQDAPRVPKPEKLVKVTVRMEKERAVIRVQDQVMDQGKLVAALRRHVQAGRDQLLLAAANDVPHGVLIQIQDEAKSAGIKEVLYL